MMKTSCRSLAMLVFSVIQGPPLHAGMPPQSPPCYSIQESKAGGYFVCSLSCAPSVLPWGGKEVAFKEAWLERRRQRNHSWNPFAPRYIPLSGYNLCLTLSKGWEVLWHGPMFVLGGREANRSFGRIGDVVLWETLESASASEYTVFLTDNFKLEKAVKISVTSQRLRRHGYATMAQ